MKNQNAAEDPLRPHTYDGIQEYDKRLPNWWLWTLYGAIAFSVGYWFNYHWVGTMQSSGQRVEAEMRRIALAAAQSSSANLTDDQLWDMSRDSKIVAAGKATFVTTCASCHQEDLSGKIGPNLKDQNWIHGGTPNEIVTTLVNGVPAKGMPTWGPVLGRAKISEVAAFVLSHHKQGEPIIAVPSPTGGVAAPVAAPN